jgi:hypothetical protein
LLAGGLCLTVCALMSAARVEAAELDVRIRLTWGEGTPRMWHGSIRASTGRISEASRLGFAADAPGSMAMQDGTLQFWQRGPTRFDGMDVRVQGPNTATIILTLVPADGRDKAQTIELPFSQFVAQRAFVDSSKLDDQQNRVVVRRAPGDRLRVEFERDSLVFAPGEDFSFKILPTHLGFSPETQLKCQVELYHTYGGDAVWETESSFEVDAKGACPPFGPLQVQMPPAEGVYDMLITLHEWKFPRYVKALERRVQLVVVDSRPEVPTARAGPPTWEEAEKIDLTNPAWWARFSLPLLSRVADTLEGPLGEENTSTRVHQGVKLTELKKWWAMQIPVTQIGRPHVLEIEYPNDFVQTMGISIVEPDRAGMVLPVGLNSGIDVQLQPIHVAPAMEKHRVIFWPRTKSPLLLLTNRREDGIALFGEIRVLVGPSSLPPVSTYTPGNRLVAAYYDKPFFPENFNAPSGFDEATRRTLDDWTKFYQGGRRLTEYLKHVGYNAAIISVLRDGSTIYPSQLLEPTLRYDNGGLFFTGQDPLRKDVLEMLFRQFDRQGLKLIPAVHFSTPLPELEYRIATSGPDGAGIDLLEVDYNGISHLARHRARQGLAPYYNPLDSRVQDAMRRVLGELTRRYAHHPSFGGLCLQLGANTFTQLPDQNWALDDRTIARFAADTKIEMPTNGPKRFADRAKILSSTGRDAWLQWRSKVLASLYQQMQLDLTDRRPDARLYLATGELLESWPVRQEMRPRLPLHGDFSQAMLRHGIVPALFADQSNIVLLRGRRHAPLTSLASQSVNVNVNESPTVDQVFASARNVGVLHFHEPQPRAVPGFELVSPFGKSNTSFQSHFGTTGIYNRARFTSSLARLDAQAIVEGGMLLPLGQEDSFKDFFRVYRALPAVPFKTIASSVYARDSMPVVIRQAHHHQATYIYALNDSAWPITVDVELDRPVNPLPLGGGAARLLPPSNGNRWVVTLQPYDLQAVFIRGVDANVVNWSVEPDTRMLSEMLKLVQDVGNRIHSLRDPVPLAVLANADFEQPTVGGVTPGWDYPDWPEVEVRTVAINPGQGNHSLYMKVTASDTHRPAWVRSKKFSIPKTGRFAIQALIRTRNNNKQPPIRMAVDLLLDGKPFRGGYIPVPLGVDVDDKLRQPTGNPVPPVSTRWQLVVGQFDDRLLEGPNEIQIGFDLMGPGEVWIDDVRVFDTYFSPNEQNKLQKNVAMVKSDLERGKLLECQSYLNGYWPRFLLEHVPPPEAARVANLPPRRISGAAPKQPTTEEKSTFWDWIPKIRLPDLPFKRGPE